MADQAPTPTPAPDLPPLANGAPASTTNPPEDAPPTAADVEMTDSPSVPTAPIPEPFSEPSSTNPPPPAAPAATPAAAAPIPNSTSTTRNSPHPAGSVPPAHAIPHGSPTRMYLNANVTPHLLEAMKHLATVEPEKPLKWLSEFLAQKSAEIEGP